MGDADMWVVRIGCAELRDEPAEMTAEQQKQQQTNANVIRRGSAAAARCYWNNMTHRILAARHPNVKLMSAVCPPTVGKLLT